MAKEIEKKEVDIQREICEHLHANGFFFWRSNNVPVYSRSNDGKMRFRALPKYTPKGLPDICIIYNGMFIGVEVKRPGGKLRPEQKDICKQITDNGGKYILADSIDLFTASIKKYLDYTETCD